MNKIVTFFVSLCFCSAAFAQNASPYWSITGNNNETGTSKLGTTNKISLHFYTNNSQRMYMDSSSGNIGIGTGVPLTKLHVVGSGSFGNRVTTANATRALNLADTAAVMRILRVDYSNAPAVELISRTSADGSNVAYWDMYTQPSDASFRIRDRLNGTNDRLTISHANGFVGIGTSTPAYKLDVNGDINTGASNVIRFGGLQMIKFDSTGGVGIGDSALYNSNIITNNIAIGNKTLYNNVMGTYNTAIGYQALYNNTTSYNTGIGYYALHNNTSGIYNVATGFQALYNNTTGSFNTANGLYTLFFNSSGNNNTSTGTFALEYNTGSNNTSNGTYAMQSNTTGYNNTAMGYAALLKNTTGYSNVAIGTNALYNNTTISNLVAVGDSALFNNIFYQRDPAHGTQNTALGSKAMYKNSEGLANTAAGYTTLYSNTTGDLNSGFGDEVLYSNIFGDANTGLGLEALYYNTSGSYNTAIGGNTLFKTISGNNNTAIGYGAAVSDGTFNNATAVGYSAIATASNQVMLGNSSVTAVEAYANYINISDGRIKKNITENVPGLEFIKQLRPVTYNYNLHSANSITGVTQMRNTQSKTTASPNKATEDKINEDAMNAKEKKIYTGFVAQEVEAIANKMNYDFSGVHHPENDKDLYGLSYSDFVAPLVKAVQELSKQNDSLQSQNIAQKQINTDLQTQINQLKSMIISGGSSSTGSFPSLTNKSVTLSSAFMLQNVPNPFTKNTTIQYSLPTGYSNAMIVITDKAGKTLKTVALNGSYSGTLQVNASTLASGAYQYALIVDGSLIDTKQMLRAK